MCADSLYIYAEKNNPSMPKRPQLESDIEHLDAFIGISSHLRDYRLAYLINQLLDFTLEKTDDLPVYSSKSAKPFYYSCYTFDDCDRQLKYFLLSNAGSEGLLVPSQKEAGYFLLIRGVMNSGTEAAIVARLKNIPNVLTAYPIDQYNIPNIENLLSDLELHEINLKRKSKAKNIISNF
jgi:hypothetical protein